MTRTHTPAEPEEAVERTLFGYLTTQHRRLDRIQNLVSAVCGVLAGVSIVATTILVLIGIVARAVFNAPLGWSVGFIEMYLLTIAAFFGIVTAYRCGAHIAVVSLFNRLPGRAQKPLLLLTYAVLLISFGSLFWAGITGTLFALATGQGPVPGSSELVIPSWIMQAVVPTSMGLGFVVVCIDLFRELSSPWTTPSTNYEPGSESDEAVLAVPVLADDAFDTDAPPTTQVTQIPHDPKNGTR